MTPTRDELVDELQHDHGRWLSCTNCGTIGIYREHLCVGCDRPRIPAEPARELLKILVGESVP
jgi:uncharacterized OB-fold protein